MTYETKSADKIYEKCHHLDFGPRGVQVCYPGGTNEFYRNDTEIYRQLKNLTFRPVSTPSASDFGSGPTWSW